MINDKKLFVWNLLKIWQDKYKENNMGINEIKNLNSRKNIILMNEIWESLDEQDSFIETPRWHEEVADMIKAIRDTEKLLGKIDYKMTEKKKNSRQFSRSLYVSKDIKKGEVFSEENIRSVRPGYGMHPKYLKSILGKVADRDFKFGDRFE